MFAIVIKHSALKMEKSSAITNVSTTGSSLKSMLFKKKNSLCWQTPFEKKSPNDFILKTAIE